MNFLEKSEVPRQETGEPFFRCLLMSTTMASTQSLLKGKYLLLSQFFEDVARYNLAEDLKLIDAEVVTLEALSKQEKDEFDEKIVSTIAEHIMNEISEEVLSGRLFFTSHIIRDMENGQDVEAFAMVLGPFDKMEDDEFWKYLAEKGNAFLPKSFIHFKLII